MFSPRSFTVSGLTFEFWIHFVFVFRGYDRGLISFSCMKYLISLPFLMKLSELAFFLIITKCVCLQVKLNEEKTESAMYMCELNKYICWWYDKNSEKWNIFLGLFHGALHLKLFIYLFLITFEIKIHIKYFKVDAISL